MSVTTFHMTPTCRVGRRYSPHMTPIDIKILPQLNLTPAYRIANRAVFDAHSERLNADISKFILREYTSLTFSARRICVMPIVRTYENLYSPIMVDNSVNYINDLN